MPGTSVRRIFLVTGIVSLFLSYLVVWVRMIDDPVQRTGSDFIIFYSAGRIAQSHGAAHVYDMALQHDVEQEQVGFALAPEQVLPYNHLPFLIPILQRVVSTDYVSSFYRWIAIIATLYVMGILVYGRLLRGAGLDRGSLQIAAVGGLLFLPFFVSLMNGQDTAFVFLGTSIWVYGLLSGKEMISGLGLSLTTVRPHIALVLALPMLFSRRRVFWGFVLGAGLLAISSFLILGLQGTREFIDMLLLSAGGEWYGIKPYAMFNLIGLLTRILPGAPTHILQIVAWTAYGLAILGLCTLWFRRRDSWNGLIGPTITLALFAAPHLYSHDLTLLLIPIYELVRRSGQGSSFKTSTVVLAPIAASLLLLVSNISPYLQYTTPYLIMLALAFAPRYLLPSGRNQASSIES